MTSPPVVPAIPEGLLHTIAMLARHATMALPALLEVRA